MRTATIALLMLLALAGCASGQMGRDAVFTTASPTSLVIFGVDLQTDYKAPDFVTRATRDYEAAQAELAAFRGVRAHLIDDETEIRSFECVNDGVLPLRECNPTQIVMSP